MDEWGHFEHKIGYSHSMSYVIMKYQDTLRVSPSVRFGWDGTRAYNVRLDCVWKLMRDGRATLTSLQSNQTVPFCHFQYGKRKAAEILWKTDQGSILRANSVKWSTETGLTVLNDTTSSTPVHITYGEKCKGDSDGNCGEGCSNCRWSWPTNELGGAPWNSPQANCRCNLFAKTTESA